MPLQCSPGKDVRCSCQASCGEVWPFDGRYCSYWITRVRFCGPKEHTLKHLTHSHQCINFIVFFCRQTIHHHPAPQQLYGFNVTSTLQIGEPSVIAHECGVTTIGDFRLADMAVGPGSFLGTGTILGRDSPEGAL